MKDSYEIIIASVPDREKLVAEIWANNQMIAEISQEQEELEVEIYCNQRKQPVKLNYDAFLEILSEAKVKLLGQGIPDNRLKPLK